jgi:hypothetical protein
MSIRKMVNTPEIWDAFVEEINIKLDIRKKTLIGTNEYEHILREQGAIRALERLLYLRDEVNGRDRKE